MVSIATQYNLVEKKAGIPVAATAFILYRQGRDFCGITEHNVKNNQMGLGRPIKVETLQRKLSASDEQPVYMLPENLLAVSKNTLAWFTNRTKKPMWFHIGGKHFCFQVVWPSLVWVVKDRTLSVFALGKGNRPTLDSVIYNAPLMNIGSSGSLCQGSAHLPKVISPESMSSIESTLLEACFTHTNHNYCLRGGATDRELIAFWKGKEKTKQRVFAHELVKVGKLGDFL